MMGDIIVPVDRLIVVGDRAASRSPASTCSSRHTRAGPRHARRGPGRGDRRDAGRRHAPHLQVAFFVAILLAALAGALWGQIYAVSPFLGERPLLMAFIVVILGGMGSIPGAALGGVAARLHRELRRHLLRRRGLRLPVVRRGDRCCWSSGPGASSVHRRHDDRDASERALAAGRDRAARLAVAHRRQVPASCRRSDLPDVDRARPPCT